MLGLLEAIVDLLLSWRFYLGATITLGVFGGCFILLHPRVGPIPATLIGLACAIPVGTVLERRFQLFSSEVRPRW